jgi:hypothetical protein
MGMAMGIIMQIIMQIMEIIMEIMEIIMEIKIVIVIINNIQIAHIRILTIINIPIKY